MLPPPAHCRSATSRVCKRWRRLVFDSPALWHSLDLDPGDRLRSQLPRPALLCRAPSAAARRCLPTQRPPLLLPCPAAGKVKQKPPPRRNRDWGDSDGDLAKLTKWLAGLNSWVDGKRFLMRRVGRCELLHSCMSMCARCA